MKAAYRTSFFYGIIGICIFFAAVLGYQWYVLLGYTKELEVLKSEYRDYVVALKRTIVERSQERNQQLCAQLIGEHLKKSEESDEKKKS